MACWFLKLPRRFHALIRAWMTCKTNVLEIRPSDFETPCVTKCFFFYSNYSYYKQLFIEIMAADGSPPPLFCNELSVKYFPYQICEIIPKIFEVDFCETERNTISCLF